MNVRISIVFCLIFIMSGQPKGFAKDMENITLAQARKMAIEHNWDIKELGETMLRAEISIQRAWSILLPSISLTGSLTRNDKAVKMPSDGEVEALQLACNAGDTDACGQLASGQIVIQELWGKNAGLSSQMTLFNPQSIPLIMNAHEQADSVELSNHHAKEELLHGVTRAYYSTLQLQKTVAVSEQSCKRAEETQRLAKARLSVGQGVRIEVLRAELEVSQAQKALRDAQNGYQLAMQSLGFLIGRPESDFTISRPARPIEAPKQEVEKLVSHALRLRKDLKATDKNVEIADRAELQAWLAFLPSFSMQGNYGYSSPGGFSGDTTSWQVMFVGVLPIFEAGTRIADLRERRSFARSAANSRNRHIEQVANEVREAALLLKQAEMSLAASNKQLELARENYAMVSRRFSVGLADNLTMIDASTSLQQAELQASLEELSMRLAVLSLRRSVGLDGLEE